MRLGALSPASDEPAKAALQITFITICFGAAINFGIIIAIGKFTRNLGCKEKKIGDDLMIYEKNRLILPLVCCAIVSVATFSGIGIAAITGQLAVTPDNGESFLASDELKKRKGAAAETALSVPNPTHVGLTRSAVRNAGEGDKPMILRVSQRFSQTLAPPCSNCGVVDSIERHDLQMPTSAAAASGGSTNTFNASVLAGSNRSVYAASRDSTDVATSFIVRLRMEDGSLRTIYEHQRPKFSVGEKVKLINGSVVSMG